MNSIVEKIWTFIRNDMNPKNFEDWVSSNTDLEEFFGEELYFDLISANYFETCDIEVTKAKLKQFVTQFDYMCSCIKIGDIDVIGMGDEKGVYLNSFSRVVERGEKYWWLYVSKCKVCQTHWLVAQEERHNDVFCLKRLQQEEIDSIINKNIWPNDFDRYEELLLLGKNYGHHVRFVDPLNSSLIHTIIDLAKERPGITIIDLCELLNIDRELANDAVHKAMSKVKLNITLDEIPISNKNSNNAFYKLINFLFR